MRKLLTATALIGAAALAHDASAAPSVAIRLPERFRLLTGQLYDLRVEAINLTDTNASIRILVDDKDVTAKLPAPEVTTNNDADTANNDKAWTFRALSYPTEGVKTVVAEVTDGSGAASRTQRIGVQNFGFADETGARIPKKNIILYIGDAMGTAYRDSGRLVAKSAGNRFREGFFDSLQNMDSLPASGMVMTYALDRVVPDSANTASAWATGNKTVDGTLGVFPDNDDFKYSSSNVQGTKQFALNNPRVETLWEYLKRLHGYRTGIVSTADITDATPAGEGSHTLLRALTFDIARQFVDGTFAPGPVFDVILGGGMEHFNKRTAVNSGDTRDLIAELQGNGYTYVSSRSQLDALPEDETNAPRRLLGLFYSSAGAAGTGTVAVTGANGNMNVAYDKLGLTRPRDEQGSNSSTNAVNFNGFTDQPFLDEMARKAIVSLGNDDKPFILMVEGASIDKQSHPNHLAGMIWDVIEFDKAVGKGREFAQRNGKNKSDTLVLVTADHDQSLSIVGLTDTTIGGSVLNTRSLSVYPRTAAPYDPASGAVAPSNAGNNVGEVVGFPDYADANGDGYPENTNRYKLAGGFRTGNHTGSSVPITAEGPGELLFTGYFDQTDIFFKMAKVLSSDTTEIDAFRKAKKRLKTIDQNY
jgi:alkaline phosphatase